MKAPKVTSGEWVSNGFNLENEEKVIGEAWAEPLEFAEADAKMMAASKKLAEALHAAYLQYYKPVSEVGKQMKEALISAGYTEGDES